MNRDLQTKLNQYAKARKKKRKWLTVIASLCAVVAVGTSYILINPADTAQQETFCGFEEHKEHVDDCYEKVLVCRLPEEGHAHSESCYEEKPVLTCSLPETDGHTHSDTCYGTEEYLSCGSEETDGHQHGEDCYGTERVLICNDANEEHEHTDECYEENEVLTCQLKECEPHHHDETCYSTRQVLICNEEETAPHQHDDSCYETQTVCTCGMEECEPHQHSEECYEINLDNLLCELPIHEHTLQCFSNPEADIENASVWERTFRNVKLTGKWNEDVLAIAQTQLGYTESTANYEVQEDGTTMKGYTRYGDWYGNAYGDWCAMFCSFCMNYAGVDRDLISFEAGCQTWVNKLSSEKYDLYHTADTYIPVPGDLVFFDWDEFDANHPENRQADHIGFVVELVYDQESKELTKIKTIEGNSGDQVRENSYEMDCEDIIGYGEIPRNPEWFTLESITDTGIQVTVEGLNSSLPFPKAEIVLSAKEIVSEESAALLASQMEADGVEDMDSILMDISLQHGDGIVEPIGPVYLSFATKDVDIDSTVYHIDEENETVTEMPAEVNEFESTVSLETEHFSLFALTLRAKSGKNVTATVEAEWDDENNVLSSVELKTISTAQICHNYDVFNGSSWTIGAGTWTAKAAANAEQTFDITDLVNSSTLSTKYRARVAENTGNPENDKSGYSEEFSLYDILDAAKPGFTDWVSGAYIEFFEGERPTNAAQLVAAFDVYHDLPSLTLEKNFDDGVLTVTATTDATFEPTYVWQYYDDAISNWITLENENSDTLNATNYSKLTPGADPLLDGGKNVRCQLKDENDIVKAVATIEKVNPLKEVYDEAIAEINSSLGLNAYPWYLNGAAKTANVEIGSTAFMDYFYYDNVARDADVPFFDGESYANYLASEYLAVKGDSEDNAAALEHVAEIWDKYIFDIFNPNPGAGVVGNYSYYPGANGDGPISTYGDKIIEWPKDNANSFHTPMTGMQKYSTDEQPGLIEDLAYDFLEGDVDYSRFIQSIDKTATADEPGDYNINRTYDVDITAETQATSVSPLAMLITVQTSWQMFDMPHANCVKGDGTYTSIEVGGAQRNTEMANLYDIKQAILRFIDYMDENFPGHNLVLGINEVQHGGSYNLINYNVGGSDKNGRIVYVSNNSDLLRESIYDWDTFGNCEHVHYDTDAMKAAAQALQSNLDGWKDEGKNGEDPQPINYNDVNKVAVIIGGGTENTNGTDGYGCTLPWGTFYESGIDAVYGIRTNVGEPLNKDGVLSWLDYSKNNTGNPYSLDSAAGYSSGSGTGNFTAKYVAPSEDAVYNYLVKIAQQELKSKGIKVQDESKNIEEVTISDTVADEFRIEPEKPFVATVVNKNGVKAYETVITPTAYDAAGNITDAAATFTVYNSDGSEKSTTTPTVMVAQNGTETTLSVPVEIPYSYEDNATHNPVSGTTPYTQTLTIRQNTNKTTDVSYDFGTVYNTNDAKLHFEVIARDDYIGSNNVFTNEGLPTVSFKHVKLDREGGPYIDPQTNEPVIVNDTVEGYDTPEVNVPIRFTADNGGSITVEVKTPVNLEDLSTTPGGTVPDGAADIVDSEYITATVHDWIDNYDQITGTVSYTWVVPGGKEYPVPVTLHVTDGDPDGDITAASEMAQKWTPKTPGTYDVVLKVTFTPDPVEDKGNFANDGGVTATRVTKLEQEGHETIIVNSSSGGTGQDTELTVTKVWSGEKGNTSNRPGSITFNVFQDGEFYDQKTVTAYDEWRWTFTDVPYRDPDNLSHIYTYTVTEDNVPNYTTTYGDMQTVPPVPYYWVEVPMEDVELTGETEYMIVDKSTGVGINADGTNKTPEVELHTAADGEYPAVVDDDAPSYFPDDGYLGWHIKYTGGTTNADNYIESASDDTTLYLKKDGAYEGATSNDTRLKDAPTDAKIHLNDKYLKIKNDNGSYSLDKADNANGAATVTFYEKVLNTALPTYRTSVTNTYIPGGERPNETAITVNKEWVNTETTTEIVINLLQNGRVIDTCTLNSETGWTHTFSTLPGTDAKLPYFDPLTGETYEYTVEEEVISGYETGYKKTVVSDPGGGMHWIPFHESSNSGSTALWDNTAYALVTSLKPKNGSPTNYLIGGSGSGFTKESASIRTADDPNTTETETFAFGSLSCSKELTGTIPADAVWTVEPIAGTQYYRLKVNGLYLGLKDDGKNFTLVSTATDKKPCCNFGFDYTSDGSGKLYGLKKNDTGQKKYLKLSLEDKGTLKAEAGDANAAAIFKVFEQVSLQSKYDTYSYEVQNISTDESSSDGKVDYAKYIDYLADNIENSDTENPDTGLNGDYYRLYLDAVGVRDNGDESYPAFKGVYITDHLSKYVTLADNGSNLGLTVNKVSMSDPDDITYLWYGNLNAATGSIGAPLGSGASVIKSVVYTRADENDIDSTGMIRVDFEPDYCLEEGYKYVVSYNVEATNLARSSADYQGSTGDPGTDYPNNHTSSAKPGYKANSFADIVYTQDGDVKIGIYDHPVIQVPVVPVKPDDPVYVPDDPADVTLKKQIDYLGDNGAEGMEDLYRLYLSLETEVIEPMDLLLVIDQSGSMGECISSDTYYYDIDLDNIENEGFEYDDDYEAWFYYDDETGYVLYYDEYDLLWIDGFGTDDEEWWDFDGYDEELGWYFRAGSGDTRQEALLNFLNGEENDHSDGFINLFRSANADNRLAILSFSDDCSMTPDRYLMDWDDTALAIHPPEPDGATNYAAAFDIANQILAEAEDSPNRKVMIFLSDGAPTLAYADGEMHHGFDETENGTSVIGTGNNYSHRTLSEYINMFIFYHEQDDNYDYINFADVWANEINGTSNSDDDDGNPHSTVGHFVEPYSTSDMEHPAYEWPLTYDLTEMDLNIPGTAFPEWDITDRTAYDQFVNEWNNMTETERINWLKLHTQLGDGYNIFYLSESAFKEFSSYNTDLPVFAMFFSDDADKTLLSGTPLNEVLKYMSGDEHPDAPTDRYYHYQSVDSAKALSNAIMSITGLSNVKITDPLSEYVDVAEAPQLEIKLTNAAYSSHSDYPYLYQNGAFTDLGELLLNTSATKIDLDTKTVNVVFKPDHIFTGEFECEASFNVLVNEYAYETYAQDGYNAAGDPFTDYPGNTTSSEKPGFYSNDGATAEWTYYGENSGDYRKPVVQVRFTGIQLKKVAMGDRDLALEGAEFDLYRELDSDTDSDITYTDETGTHYLQKVNQDVLISGNDGIVEVDGLCTGQYYLFETKAPAGYNRLEKPVLFSIVQGGEIGFQIVHSITDANADVDDTDDLLLLIRNSTGYELPETGGIGTLLYYALGGLTLMVSTLMYGFMTRRKRERRAN